MWKKILEILADNYAAGIFSLSGLLFAIWPLFIQKKKRICAIYKPIKIKDDFSIRVNNKNYTDVYLANYIIWNNSKTVIRNEDIANKSPLRIEPCSPDTEIIDCKILIVTNEYNNISIIRNDKDYNINFDFMENGDGTVIQVVYKGKKDGIRADGKIIGGKRIYKPLSKDKLLYKTFNSFKSGKFIKKLLSNNVFFFLILFVVLVMYPVAFLQSSNYGFIPVNLTGFDKMTPITLSLDIFLIVVEIVLSLYLGGWLCVFRYESILPKKLSEYL